MDPFTSSYNVDNISAVKKEDKCAPSRNIKMMFPGYVEHVTECQALDDRDTTYTRLIQAQDDLMIMGCVPLFSFITRCYQ